MKELNKNIKVLFKNIIYNCSLIDIIEGQLIFDVGGKRVSIYPFLKCEGDDEVGNTLLSLDKIRISRGLSDFKWSIHAPYDAKLKLFTYKIDVGYTTYTISNLSLSEQEEFYNRLNIVLTQFEDEQLTNLMSASLE